VLVLDSSALFAASGEQSVLPLIFSSLMHLLLADLRSFLGQLGAAC